MLITLVGYRGAGKSTVAPLLAERLKWEWVDADAVIETHAGKSIRDIFLEDGEVTFRRHEREVMHSLLQRDCLVIAAGGGAILNEQTRQEMRDAGPVVWLTAPVETIVARMGADESSEKRRPNLTAIGGPGEVRTVLQEREPLYRACADVIVDTDGRDVPGIVEGIVAALEPLLAEGAAG